MKGKRIIYGLLFIAAAVFIVLNQLDMIDVSIDLASIVLGAIFACTLIGSIINRSFFGTFFSAGFLWIIFDEPFGLPELSTATVLLVALFLTIGFSVIFPANYRKHYQKHYVYDKREDYDAYDDPAQTGKFQKIIDEEIDGTVRCENKFGATAKYINSSDLRAAFLENSFGEMKVYFDNATIINEPVEIKVDCSFGNMELYIPKEWNVYQKITAFAAGVNEKNKSTSSGKPVVNIVGNASFGEVSIIYV